jgi:hypothetical protein
MALCVCGGGGGGGYYGAGHCYELIGRDGWFLRHPVGGRFREVSTFRWRCGFPVSYASLGPVEKMQ